MYTLSKDEQGHLLLSGVLNYGVLPDIYQAAQPLLPQEGTFTVDLKGVTYSNSAGLALLLEWARWAREKQLPFCIENFPSQLFAMARLMGVSALLQCGGNKEPI